MFSVSDKKQFSTQTHKEQPETALILERPAETKREKRQRQTNKHTLKKKPLKHLTSKKKKAPKITIGKMFLGLRKPIKIKYKKKKQKKKPKQKKIMCQRSSFICGCDTVLSNNKRYLTIAFTVLEEIYFSLPAQKKSTLHSGGNHRDPNKGNNIQVGITC